MNEEKKKEGMTFREAMEAAYAGCRVKRPRWGGYIHVKDGQLWMHMANGEDKGNIMFEGNVSATDWMIQEAGMHPYQQRMLLELEQLSDRLNGLSDFLETEIYAALPEKERTDMTKQFQAMNQYLGALERRCIRQGIIKEEESDDKEGV